MEIELRRGSATGMVAIVDVVVAPIVEQAHGAIPFIVVVFELQGSKPASDLRVVVDIRIVLLAGIRGIETVDIEVSPRLPEIREIVAKFHKAKILLKLAIGAVAIGAAIAKACRAREAPLLDLVGDLALESAIGTAFELHVGINTISGLLSRNDVHHAAHGVGAVEHRCRAAQDLHTLGQHSLVGVGNGMAIQSRILRLAVDEHKRLGSAADAAHLDAAGSTRGNAIAKDASRGNEEARHLLRDSGERGRTEILCERGTIDHANGEREVAHIGSHAGAGNHGGVQRQTRNGVVGIFGTGSESGSAQKGKKDLSFHVE